MSSRVTALAACHVVWDSPSENSAGSMPIGNGDIGLNVWVEPGGDVLFYVGKTDAWSENARLLKLGRVRVSLSPNPAEARKARFRQELRLRDGEIVVEIGSATLRVWVDANAPVVHVEAASDRPMSLTAAVELWRTEPRQIKTTDEMWTLWSLMENPDLEVIVQPDTIAPASDGRLTWYHRNESSIYELTMKTQHLGKFLRKYPDPLTGLTFGASMEGAGMAAADDRTLVSARPRKRHHLTLCALTAQTPSADAWQRRLRRLAAKHGRRRLADTRKAHRAWWRAFWDRSWIFISGAADAKTVTQGYVLQRWMVAGCGRGAWPIAWNGGTYTFDTQWAGGRRRFDADFRRWGGCYWFQNTRQVYWPTVPAGDYDLAEPWFEMFRKALPLAEDRSREYYGHRGAMFPETLHFWGTYANRDYGWDRTGAPKGLATNSYITRYWQGGIELLAIMLDRWANTRDTRFARRTLVPIASAVATFYAEHWPAGPDGKICFHPAQALETYHGATNPLPEIAGLRYVLPRLMALPKGVVTESQYRAWRRLMDRLPEVPMRQTPDGPVLAPAEMFSDQGNSENVALYALFPYRLYGVGKEGMDVADRTWRRRGYKTTGCWRQESVHAAAVGRAAEARRYVHTNFANAGHAKGPAHVRRNIRFPAMWCTGDWIPDLDHGGVASIGLQRMLMQCQEDEIRLLPAWPKDWDVDFRLHAPGRTVVAGSVRGGRIVRLNLTPPRRRKDVIVMNAQQERP